MVGIRNRKKRRCLFLLIVSHKNAIKMECYSLGVVSVCGGGGGGWGRVGYVSRICSSVLEKGCFFSLFLSLTAHQNVILYVIGVMLFV